MKYFIGYLISGEAADWHKSTARKISEEFNIWKIYEKIPPHITIFYPEGVEDISDTKEFIKYWIKQNKILGNLYITDFDHFDDRVVFAKVEMDKNVKDAIESLKINLTNLTGVKEDYPTWHPHATLAYKLSPDEISKIWTYTNELAKPDFILPFNNITIFKFIGDKEWVVDESFSLS